MIKVKDLSKKFYIAAAIYFSGYMFSRESVIQGLMLTNKSKLCII